MRIVWLAILFLFAATAAATDFSIAAGTVVEVTNNPDSRRVDPEHPLSNSVPAWQLSRILFDFDLKSIPANDFGKLEKAVIRIDFSQVDNPESAPTLLGAVKEPWRDHADRLGFGGAPWPSRGVEESSGEKRIWQPGLLEFGYTPLSETAQVITTPGSVEFDVTREVAEQLFFGAPGYGFILRTGPQHLGGLDNTGTWSLELAGRPELRLTFAGEAPTVANQRERTLRYFPSAALPPVREPYLFVFYNWNSEVNALLWPRFRVFNTDGIFDDSALNQRGILTLAARGGQQVEWPFDYNTYRAEYDNCRFGIAIDEWQSVKDDAKRDAEFDHDTPMGWKIDASIQALRDLKQERPELFVGVYWRGEISMRPLAEVQLPDLILCEGYTRLPRFPQWEIGKAEGISHFELARADGYYERAINLHGTISVPMMFPDYSRHFTPESIAEEVRYLREKYPEVAGSGVYCEISPQVSPAADAWKWHTQEAIEAVWPVLAAYEAALQEHFIAPAPEVVWSAPDFEAQLSAPHVRLQVRATPRDGRSIRQYRWFIDNRLVAETSEPEYIWDTRDTEAGRHILTVHAVDSAWNRAAAQLPIQLHPSHVVNPNSLSI